VAQIKGSDSTNGLVCHSCHKFSEHSSNHMILPIVTVCYILFIQVTHDQYDLYESTYYMLLIYCICMKGGLYWWSLWSYCYFTTLR